MKNTKTTEKHPGQKIRETRLRLGLLSYHLAARAEVNPCALSEIEHGRRNPTEEQLARILKALDDAAREQ